MACTECIDLW